MRLPIYCLAGLAMAFPMAVPAATLFYNGTPDVTQNGNLLDCSNCRSSLGEYVYDNFTASSTWSVSGLFGNYFVFSGSAIPTSATWVIRQGISQGVDGTVVATGSSSWTTQSITTPPGGSTSYQYFQGSLSIANLTLGPGNYWLAISPNTFDAGTDAFVLGAFGAAGTNSIIDGTSFKIGTYDAHMQNIGAYLQPFTGHSNYDWSYGVNGTAATPEPASALLVIAGLALAGYRRVRRD